MPLYQRFVKGHFVPAVGMTYHREN